MGGLCFCQELLIANMLLLKIVPELELADAERAEVGIVLIDDHLLRHRAREGFVAGRKNLLDEHAPPCLNRTGPSWLIIRRRWW